MLYTGALGYHLIIITELILNIHHLVFSTYTMCFLSPESYNLTIICTKFGFIADVDAHFCCWYWNCGSVRVLWCRAAGWPLVVRRYERVRVSLSISRLEDHKSYNKTVTVVSHHQPPTQYKFNLHINIYQLACSDTLRLRRRSNQTRVQQVASLPCQNRQDLAPSLNHNFDPILFFM